MLCPCGSQLTYSDCCQPLIEQQVLPQSPEALMRSRYSAYALAKSQYILDSYASKQQAEHNLVDIDQWAKQTKWLKLTIIDTSPYNQIAEQNQPTATQLPTVTFSALYIFDNKLYTLSEKSRFAIENGRWKYVDGDLTDSAAMPLPSRNELCPCGSNKKFKRCCGK